MVVCTNDDNLIKLLSEGKWDVVFFAPGACRYSAGNYQIPGGNQKTKGWNLGHYRELVRKFQGKDI
jgi:hypothetical protein